MKIAEIRRRLAGEYDAAQERGEVATRATTLRQGADVEQNNGIATASDLGISRKDIHEARKQSKPAGAVPQSKIVCAFSAKRDRGLK